MRHAAIDIGTNSFHLVVANSDGEGGFDVITTEKEMIRLGHGGTDMNELADDAMDRGVAALVRMAAVASSMGADVSAVATSAVREASNKNEFLRRARDEAGVEVEVISGVEEARLIHLGVLQALSVYEERILVVDIGGGSTEFVVGKGLDVWEARSLKLGAIRLTDRFLRNSDGTVNTSADAINHCRRFVRSTLGNVQRELIVHNPELAIGSSGTIATLTAMTGSGESTLSRQGLQELVDSFVESNLESRLGMKGLDEKRADIIVAGAALLIEVFHAFALTEMRFSPFALREGVLLDRLGGSAGAGLERLHDLRGSNVAKLARDLDPDFHHAEHAAKLALDIFDQTVELHGLTGDDRELLHAGAMLHNIGLFINHAAHHKHSYYIVRNTEQLTGFTDREIELIAQITRYHRKSHPKPSHAEFSSLSSQDKDRVRTLAGILRIAIGLDRSHAGTVTSVNVSYTDDLVRIEPVAARNVDIELELFAANERTGLLSLSLKRAVKVELS